MQLRQTVGSIGRSTDLTTHTIKGVIRACASGVNLRNASTVVINLIGGDDLARRIECPFNLSLQFVIDATFSGFVDFDGFHPSYACFFDLRNEKFYDVSEVGYTFSK